MYFDSAAGVLVSVSICSIIGHGGAWAADYPSHELVQTQPFLPEALKQITDQEGLRSRLEQLGVQFTFNYIGEEWGNSSGGERQGARYDGRLAAIIDADLNKLLGWQGATFYASIHELQGSALSTKNIDNLMTVSNVQEPATTRLYYLLVDQKLGDDATLRMGQFTAAREFLVSENASLFLNTTFGWMLLPAQDLPSGGPAYPEATPGIRLKLTPNDQLTLMAAIFNGDPAGPGTGNPIKRDSNGLAFRVNDPPFLITELSYAYNRSNLGSPGKSSGQSLAGESAEPGLPGSVKLGAWLYTGSVAGDRFGSQGGTPGGSGAHPTHHAGDFSAYGVIDQALWRIGGPQSDRGLNFFLRASAAPSDRNLVDLYFDTGLTFKGPIRSRPDDTVGIGFALARFSPQALAGEQMAAGNAPVSLRSYEAAIEITYQWQIAQNWSVQPDFQYIIHPSGQLANSPAAGTAPLVPNATVFGIRTVVNF